MRHRTRALLLAAGMLLAGCTSVKDSPTGDDAPAGGVATPPIVSAPAAPVSVAPPTQPTPPPAPRTTLPTTQPTYDLGNGTNTTAPESTPTDDHGGATALCNDGTLSHSKHHQGTCSHHHGVREWYR